MRPTMCSAALLAVLLPNLIIAQRQARGGGNVSTQLRRQQELETRAQEALSVGSLLQAAENDAHNEELGLNQQSRRQARLDKKAERQKKKQARKAQNEQKRLQAANSVDFETFDNDEQFHELDAAADLSKANKFGLSIISENRHDEKAAISENTGSKSNSGTRLSADDYVNGEEIFQEEDEFAELYINNEALDAAEGDEDILQAQEKLNKQQNAQLNAQDYRKQQGLIQGGGIFGQDGGFGQQNGFSNGINGGFQDFFSGGGTSLFGNSFGRRK